MTKEKVLTWLKYAGLRALKTLAQTAIATIGTTAFFHEVDWVVVGSASLLAAILSLLTSLTGIPEVKEDQGAKTGKHFSEDQL